MNGTTEASNNQGTREYWRGKPWEQRLTEYKKTYIQHADVLNAIQVIDEKLKEIEDCGGYIHQEDYLNSPTTFGCGLMLIGASGSGKSSLARFILNRHPIVKTPFQTYVPAIYFKIPPNPSPKSMAQALLTGLGHKDTSGTAKELMKRAVALCEKCAVRIIMIDDFHDIPARRIRGMAAIGDWVRQLIDAVQALVIAMGTTEAEKVRDSNEQVRRRMQATALLAPFLVEEKDHSDYTKVLESLNRWQAILQEIDEKLPLAKQSFLTNPTTSINLLRASNSSFSHLSTLLQRAMKVAVEEGMEEISNEHLRIGFERTFGAAAKKGNPFDPGYDGLPLTLPGQAFFKYEVKK